MSANTIPAWYEKFDGSMGRVLVPVWERVLVGGDDDSDYYVSFVCEPNKPATRVRVEKYNGGSDYEPVAVLEVRTGILINASATGFKSLFTVIKAYLLKCNIPIARWAEA